MLLKRRLTRYGGPHSAGILHSRLASRRVHGLDLLPDNLNLAFAARYSFTNADRQLAEFRDLIDKADEALVLSVEALVHVPFHGVEALIHRRDDEQLQDGDERRDRPGSAANDASLLFSQDDMSPPSGVVATASLPGHCTLPCN